MAALSDMEIESDNDSSGGESNHSSVVSKLNKQSKCLTFEPMTEAEIAANPIPYHPFIVCLLDWLLLFF